MCAQAGPRLQTTNGEGSVQCTAQRLFDGANGPREEDVTQRAVWSVSVNGSTDPGYTNSRVHISNSPSDSGLLQIRTLAPEDQVIATAQVGSLASVLISPVRTGVVAARPQPFQMYATVVTASGANSDVTNQVAWSSDRPDLVTISPLGVVTLAPLPLQTTLVKVQARKRGRRSSLTRGKPGAARSRGGLVELREARLPPASGRRARPLSSVG